MADRDRRRWNDHSLDLIKEDVDELKQFTRILANVPGLMQGIQEQLEETQKDVRELREAQARLFERNFREHQRVEQTTKQIAQDVGPTRWSKAKDFATFVSVLLVPILVALIGIYASQR